MSLFILSGRKLPIDESKLSTNGKTEEQNKKNSAVQAISDAERRSIMPELPCTTGGPKI